MLGLNEATLNVNLVILVDFFDAEAKKLGYNSGSLAAFRKYARGKTAARMFRIFDELLADIRNSHLRQFIDSVKYGEVAALASFVDDLNMHSSFSPRIWSLRQSKRRCVNFAQSFMEVVNSGFAVAGDGGINLPFWLEGVKGIELEGAFDLEFLETEPKELLILGWMLPIGAAVIVSHIEDSWEGELISLPSLDTVIEAFAAMTRCLVDRGNAGEDIIWFWSLLSKRGWIKSETVI